MMQDARDFLGLLRDRGTKLWNDNGQLRFQAPKGKLLPEEIDKLRALKAEIMELLAQPQCGNECIEPRPSGCPVPLTATQSWYRESFVQARGGLSRRSCSISVNIEGELDPRLLQACLDTVVRRHESLRVRIVTAESHLRQQIDIAGEWPLEQIDLTRSSDTNANEALARLAHELVDERLDLAVGPLIKARLFRVSPRHYVLLLALDHLITDGISKALVHGEIWTLYNQGIRNQPLTLPKPNLQYGDYAVWEQRMRPLWREQQKPYWESRFAGVRPIELPRVSGPDEMGQPVSSMAHISFGEGLSAKLGEFARHERTLLSVVVLMLYIVVIRCWCDQRDVLLPIVWHGRDRPELEEVVGFISSAIFVRVEVLDNETFLDLVRKVSREFSAAYDHQELGVEYLAKYGAEMIFNWRPAKHSQWTINPVPDTPNQVRVKPFPFRAIRPITFAPLFSETAAGIEVAVLYTPHLLPPGAVDRFRESLRQLAKALVENPSANVMSVCIKMP